MKRTVPVESASALIDERIAELKDWRGQTLAKVRKIVHEADPEIVEGMVDVYRAHRPSLALLPDAAECLGLLQGRVALAAISDGPCASQKAKAAALDLARWCRPIVLTEELGPGLGKPHPAAFQLVEAESGHHGPACAYVADNPRKDFQAPRALSWRTIRIRRPGGLHQQVPTIDPVDAELPELTNLAQILGLDDSSA